MYKKKNRMPVIVTGAAVGALILVLLLLSLFTKKKPEEPVEETAKHEVLIYKATGGSLEFPESYLESENDTEVRLSVEEDAMVTFIAKPQAGKIFGGLTINMAKDINQEISYLVNDVKGEDKRINFVMPQGDVLVNMKFVTEEEAQEQTPPADEPEETEAVSEKTQEAPYGLTLHGLTGEILACVTYPGYDNNRLSNSMDVAYYNSLAQDQSRPFYNKATQQTTAPGSTFKSPTRHMTVRRKTGRSTIISTSTMIPDGACFPRISKRSTPTCLRRSRRKRQKTLRLVLTATLQDPLPELPPHPQQDQAARADTPRDHQLRLQQPSISCRCQKPS